MHLHYRIENEIITKALFVVLADKTDTFYIISGLYEGYFVQN